MDTNKYYRNKKLVQIMMLVMIVGVFVFLIIGYVLFYEPPIDIPLTPTPSLTPTPDDNSPSIVPTIAVNDNAKIYYILPDSVNSSGKLLSFDPVSKTHNEIIKLSIFKQLIGIDPSNSYLAYLNNNETLSFLDLSNNSELRTDHEIGWYGYFYDDSTFIAVTHDKAEFITLPSLDISRTVEFDLPSDSDILGVSFDLTYLIAYETSNLKRGYILNINDNTVKYLERYDLDDDISFNYLSFISSNDIMYFNSIGLSILYPSNMTTKRFISLNLNSIDNDLTKLELSSNASNYYFIYKNNLFRYNISSQVNRSILDIRDFNIKGFDDIVDFNVSPNEKYISIETSSNASIYINLSTLKYESLCDFYCVNPIWEN